MIEKVIIKTTLKAGSKVWEEGAFVLAPLPPVILEEIQKGTGTVEIVEGNDMPRNKLVFVAKRVEEQASSMTTMQTKPPPIKQAKSKPKLIRR